MVKLYDLTSFSESASCVLSSAAPSREQPVVATKARTPPLPPKEQQAGHLEQPLDSETGEPRAPPTSASPFTVPVAMLLFRVARALHKESGARARAQSGVSWTGRSHSSTRSSPLRCFFVELSHWTRIYKSHTSTADYSYCHVRIARDSVSQSARNGSNAHRTSRRLH